MIQSLTKTLAVIVSSTILATLTVNAVDMRGYLPDTLLALLFNVRTEEQGPCPEGMVLVTQSIVPFCVDMYEVSAGATCPFSEPTSNEETALNLAEQSCTAVSKAQAKPWRHVTQLQAQQACSRAGKRLLSPDEWYKSALGTPDTASGFVDDGCNVARNRADGVAPTGNGMRCVSDTGAYDMVGNVWEWVDGVVSEGKYNEREVPVSGYVTGADLAGMTYTTGTAQDEQYGSDRFWSDKTILAGIMRGGYYDNASQAGLFATYMASPQTFSGDAVGFRCAVTPGTQYD
jgi:formylglycine-generating enzyme required for sulfatase activity